jgi:hypothetical protein
MTIVALYTLYVVLAVSFVGLRNLLHSIEKNREKTNRS